MSQKDLYLIVLSRQSSTRWKDTWLRKKTMRNYNSPAMINNLVERLADIGLQGTIQSKAFIEKTIHLKRFR